LVLGDETVNKYKEMTHRILSEYNEGYTFHDFRVVQGPTHTNLIFDIVIPHKYKLTEKELIAEINNLVHKDNENYFLVITVDNCYI
ncbi:MAG: cation-efflux pump, partial [Clostridia bacterium]|nr:cation-efflux pump [Clostridia bacterium]